MDVLAYFRCFLVSAEEEFSIVELSILFGMTDTSHIQVYILCISDYTMLINGIMFYTLKKKFIWLVYIEVPYFVIVGTL